MKIKNKLKNIVLLCSLFILVFCFSIPVFAGYSTSHRMANGNELPDLPTIVTDMEYVLFCKEFKTLYLYIYKPHYSIGIWDNYTPYRSYNNAGNNPLTYSFPSDTVVYSCSRDSSGNWSAWTLVSNPTLSSTATPPSIYIELSSKDIIHTKDSSIVFFKANSPFYSSVPSEPEVPSGPEEPSEEPSEPEVPSEPEEPSEEPSEPIIPSDPEEPSEEPSEPIIPSVPEEPSGSDMPAVPIKPPKPVVTDEFLLSFGDFIRGFFTNIVDFIVGLVCFGCVLFIGVVGLVFSIARKRF